VLEDEMVRPVGSTQSDKVDVRIIAATAQDLAEAVKQFAFRDDLFYRINVLSIQVPPLRDRKEDIPLLVNHFIEKFNKRLQKEIKGIRPDALQALMEYPWPGNVRELENVVERTMVLTDRFEIHVDELPEEIRSGPEDSRDVWPTDSMSLKTNTRALEKTLIQKALRETNNNRTRAAKLLEISHPTLLSKMKAYKIS
jgi:two-component system response regulator AtoC